MRFNVKRYFQVLGICVGIGLFVILGYLGYDTFFKTSLTNDELTDSVAEVSGGKINVLLMGVDEDGLRTDAIMVVQYDTKTNKANLMSIPRDTRMYIGSRYQKINAAHAIGSMTGNMVGAAGTIEAVQRLTAIPINYYIEFSFQAIEDLMDELGPVKFTIPDLYGDGVGMKYDDPEQDLHIDLPPGDYELTGEQIVWMLRYRKNNMVNGKRNQYTLGDSERMELQREFIKALTDQKMNASLITKLPGIFKVLESELKTNFTLADVMKYSKYLYGFTSDDITTFVVPGEGDNENYDADYFIADLDELRVIIEENFGYDASKITIDPEYGKPAEGKYPANATKSPSSVSDADD